MKTLLLFIILFGKVASATTVYVCDGHGAKKYHLKANCRGLRNCSHRVIKISMEEARKRGKTLCGWEK